MREAGFTLIELLVATAITVAVIGAVLAFLNPAHGMHRSQPEVADLHQRLRVSVETLRRDLLMAGAGTHLGRTAGMLGRVVAPVMPYRTGEVNRDPATGVYYRRDAITMMYVPPTPAQATIIEGTPLGSTELRVDARFNCGPVSRTELCGFDEGMRVLVFDQFGTWDAMTIARIESPSLILQHRRSRPPNVYGGDAAIAHVELHTYYLSADTRTSTFQLRHYDGFETDVPVVDDVVALEFEYYGDPEPPRLLAGAVLSDPDFPGPVTTYGPRPPAAGVDRATDNWPAGENCAFALVDGVHVSRLPVLAATTGELAPLPSSLLQDGPWCPDAAAADRFDADLLRIRRIRAKVRVQAGSATLRGPAGALFMHGGVAADGYRLVPDQEVVFDVAPRNMSARR